MPIRIEEGKTPKGKRCMRAMVSGYITLADAVGMRTLLDPGHSYHQALVFCAIEKGTQYSPEARPYFKTFRGNYKRMSAVVTSTILRASINFLLRTANFPDDFRMFNSEEAAMAYLDEA